MNTNLVATGSPAATDVSFEPGMSAVGGETIVPQTSAEVRVRPEPVIGHSFGSPEERAWSADIPKAKLQRDCGGFQRLACLSAGSQC
jgi:hypothetical protein